MSAIAGAFRLDGRPVSEREVDAMVRTMRHRGPDRLGAWSEGSVGLAHAMLVTTPEAQGERLPLTAGPFAITADARIDNRDTLLAVLADDLNALGLAADIVPDSSLILAAYARWGRDAPAHLLGDFAFAVWDGRTHTLFCARDHLGVRPLYYVHRPGALFAFASEPKGLFALDEVTPRVDDVRMAEALTARLYEPVATPFEGVVKVPAAHTLTVGLGTAETVSYWSLQPREDVGGGSYAEGFAEVFTEAVRCRLRAVGPVASELSGGLDSSAVTVVAAKALGSEPLHTVSLAYSDPRTDERRFGQLVLDRLGDQAVDHYIHPERERIVSLYTEIYQTLDDVRVRGNGYGNYLTAREASRHGARVLLTGQDGDTAVGHGWEWFSERALAGDWDALRIESERVFERCREDEALHDSQFTFQRPQQIASAYVAPLFQYWAEEKEVRAFAAASRAVHRTFGASLLGPSRQYWKLFATPAPLRRRRQQQILLDTARKRIPKTIDPELVAHTDLASRIARRLHTEAELSRGRFTAFEAQLRVLTSDAIEANLHKIDLYSSASGVEARHPFMDVRLLEYCLAVPSGEKLHDGYTRYVLREALRDDLPSVVRERMNKMHHGAQQSRFIFDSEPNRVADLLDAPSAGARYLDMPVVRRLWERGRAGSPALGEWEIAAFSAALTTLLWFRVSPVTPGAAWSSQESG